MYSENYLKINNCITLLMNPEDLIEEDSNLDIGICEECTGEINCNKDNVYILSKDESIRKARYEARTGQEVCIIHTYIHTYIT